MRFEGILQSDAFEWLRSLESESVDLVITDPPYESLELHRAKGTTTRLKVSDGSSNQWFGTIPNARLVELVSEVYRVLNDDRHFYLFCDESTADIIKAQQFDWQPDRTPRRNADGSYPCAAGFKFWRELLWVKATNDGTKARGGMGYHYRGATERILFFEKGKRKLDDLGISDVFMAPRGADGYPTQKPLEVARTLVTQSTVADELVIDPFMGSGTTLVAAQREGRRFAGCDLSPDSLAMATQRLAAFA